MKELFQHVAITPVGKPALSGHAPPPGGHEGIVVRVAVNFLPEQSRIEAGKWFWVYHIRIENLSDRTVQLLTRHWRITDGRGAVNFVDGEGVVGEQPVLRPGQSHDYVSGCPLQTPTWSMEGHYTFRSEDGSEIKAAIPFFPLAAPATAG
jgi:ApaG protein